MKKIELETIDVENFEVVADTFNLRRDLHTFIRYIEEHEVKRSVRGNGLPKTDARRLAKSMSNPAALEEVEDGSAASCWVDHVDRLALKLGFVEYETKGVYLGYSSSQESYPDNYIRIEEKEYRRFQALSLQQQERELLDALVKDCGGGSNEFFSPCGYTGRLDRFRARGTATGVLPFIGFGKVRKILLDVLAQCRSGIWYATASLIRYLKSAHPFFLIPEKPRYKYPGEEKEGRYRNFYEGKNPYDNGGRVSPKDPLAFEKVEGRYVERFLEGIPLTLGYVQAAYGPQDNPGIFPSMGCLKAFRVDDRFLRLMKGETPEPRVIVQPNFEIHVEADFYPAGIMAELAPFTDVKSSDRVCILKLNKSKVVVELARRDGMDLSALLTRIGRNPLPQNIAMEIAEWAGHSETFTLFRGFGLLESRSALPQADPFTVETLSPGLRMVRSPEALFSKLEEAEMAPIQVIHPKNGFKQLPSGVESVFAPKRKAAAKAEKRQTVILKRRAMITIHVPTKSLMETCVNALVKAGCPVETDTGAQKITFAADVQAKIQKALDSIEAFRIKIEDME